MSFYVFLVLTVDFKSGVYKGYNRKETCIRGYIEARMSVYTFTYMLKYNSPRKISLTNFVPKK